MSAKPAASMSTSELDALCIDTIRFLSVDAVQKANSGHPGLPMGAAPVAYVLWTKFLKHNPANPKWFGRDRFILTAGHGSMLLYSLLFLTGYDLPIEQIHRFRQWGSTTPGHPERGETPGVETTTGPLGQGFGNGVGMAMAEAHLAARFNQPGFPVIDHYTYALASDGDLMEGVSAEAASLAGHLKLGKLIYFYDSNYVSLAASTNLTLTEDIARRFEAQDWHAETVADGNDLAAIHGALEAARAERDRPSLIIVHSHLGYGSPNKQDNFEAHGSPLGENEVRLTKENLGWPVEPPFYLPPEAVAHFRTALERGRREEAEWNDMLAEYRSRFPDLAAELTQTIGAELPEGWDADIPVFPPDPKGMATRVASGRVMNAIAPRLAALAGGSADLNPSTYTPLHGVGDFQPPLAGSAGVTGPGAERESGGAGPPDFEPDFDTQGAVGGGWSYAGRNFHYGVREHAMGAITNGLAAHGGIIPFAATFLIFSDYMRPPIRLASLMGLHVIYIFTHDSVGLGEDGPTHQPVEQLANLRAVPRLVVIRPADANETAEAWRVAIETSDRPVALVFSRQNVPTLDRSHLASAEGLRRGAYVLYEPDSSQSVDSGSLDYGGGQSGEPDVILVASGSEVQLIVGAGEKLRERGVRARLVSMPSWELFKDQAEEYRRSVFPPAVRRRVAVEAGSPQGWCKYVGDTGTVIGIERFGASAPGATVLREYGFTVENVVDRTLEMLKGR